MTNSVYIPPRFSNEVLSHIAGVYSSLSKDFPLILGLFGNPGEGKTYMCEQLFLQYNIKKTDFSVNEFEHEYSGIPAQKLREKYDTIVKQYTKNKTYGVLLINDIDTAIGNWGDMHQYTVNTQHIIGELMQIADPHTNFEKRIPIIITGNDFTTIYGPLKRSGRISPFYWKPTEIELTDILANKFPKLTRCNIENLVKKLNAYASCKGQTTLPVSFYSSLKNKLYKQDFDNIFKENTSLSQMISSLENHYLQVEFSEENLLAIGKIEIEKISSMNKKYLGDSTTGDI